MALNRSARLGRALLGNRGRVQPTPPPLVAGR